MLFRSTAPTAAGSYTITPSATFTVGSASSYSSVTYTSSSFTINKAVLTATPSGATATYGDSAPVYGISVTGFKNSETTSTAAGDVAPTCTSTYSATSAVGSSISYTCSGGSATNYTITNSGSGSVVISKATLTITPAGKSVTYGDPAPTYTFSVSGFKNSETTSTATSYSAPTCT